MLPRILTVLTLAFTFSACAEDVIDLVAQAGVNPATVLLDGRRESCVNDQLLQGSSQLKVDNVRAPAGCSSELFVFADSHTGMFVTPAWTDGGNDVVPVNMISLANVPLAVWIMFENADGTRAEEVEFEVNRASQLFDTEKCGMEFTVAVNPRTTGFGSDLIDAGCERLADFKQVGEEAGKINVYYIRSVNGNQGQRCLDGNSDVLLIGAAGNDSETLAHELGHALSLGHWNDTQGFAGDNLMLSPGSNRDSISIGQCFRANINVDSVFQRSGISKWASRTCPDAATNSSCPSLAVE